MSSNFGQMGLLTVELAALKHLKNDVSTFSRLPLIWSSLNLQVTKTCIKSWTSSNFGQIRTLTAELVALECLKNIPKSYNGKVMSPCI